MEAPPMHAFCHYGVRMGHYRVSQNNYFLGFENEVVTDEMLLYTAEMLAAAEHFCRPFSESGKNSFDGICKSSQ